MKQLLRANLATILVLLSYLFFTVYYMGPSVWNCGNTVYGFGDNTAGPIWRFGLEPKQPPLGTYTNQTNYPVGEQLYNPTSYSLLGQIVLEWGTSRLVGPICGYNIVNMLGFVASALVMYGFIFVLTKKRSIAWLAGYAVSFSPYYQMKVGGHVGYGYQALLIGSAWALFNLFKYRRKKDAVVFGVVAATTAYFDPYFSLLLASIVGPLVVVWAATQWVKGRKNKRVRSEFFSDLKRVILGFAVLGLLLLPLAGVVLKNNSQISSSVASLRGNILFEAKSCSNLLHEYAVPFVLHPVFQRAFGKDDYTRLIDDFHSGFTCGIGEDTVGISLVVLFVTLVGLVIFTWEYLNKRRLGITLTYNNKLVIIGMCLVAFTAILLALPPAKIFGFPTPSYALLEITTTWRTLTRFYVVVNFATITLFSIVLLFAFQHLQKYKKILGVVFVCLFLAILVEYQAFKPFIGNKLSTFSYIDDVPPAYNWLRDQSNINEIAEFPIEKAGGESNATAYYLTMQTIHKKTLFNANNPLVKEEDLRNSLKDISDTQTVQVLAAVGIDAVVIHGVSEEDVAKINGLEIIYVQQQAPFNILAFTPLVKNDITIIAKVVASPATTMLRFDSGFARNATIIRSAADWEYEVLSGAKMSVTGYAGGPEPTTQPTRQCFMIRLSSEEQNARVQFIVDDLNVTYVDASSKYSFIEINAGKSIVVTADDGQNMRIKDLGCPL